MAESNPVVNESIALPLNEKGELLIKFTNVGSGTLADENAFGAFPRTSSGAIAVKLVGDAGGGAGLGGVIGLAPKEKESNFVLQIAVNEGLNEVVITNQTLIAKFGSFNSVAATDGVSWIPVEVQPDSSPSKLVLFISAPRGCTSVKIYNDGQAAIESSKSITPLGVTYQNTPLALSASHSLAAGNNPILSYVHPSIVYFPSGWNGKKYWMTATPWSAAGVWPAEDAYEDAILFTSDDKVTWTPVNINASGFNNLTAAGSVAGRVATDTRLCYDEQANTLYAYFRTTNSGVEQIWRIQTTNGTTWTDKAGTQGAWDSVTLNGNTDWTAGTPLPTATGCLSPSIVKTGSQWDLWATAYETDGYSDIVLRNATSLDGLAFFGGADFYKPYPKGFQGVWHSDVQYDPDKNIWILLGQLQGSSHIGTNGSTNSNVQMIFTSENKYDWKMWDVPVAISGVDVDTARSCNCYKGAIFYEGSGNWVVATSYRLKQDNTYRVALSPPMKLNARQPRSTRPTIGVFHESQGRWFDNISVSGLGVIQREPAWYSVGVNSIASVSGGILSIRRGTGAAMVACGTRWKRAFRLKTRLKLATLTSTLKYSHEISPNLGFWFDAPNSRVRLSGDDTTTGNWTPHTNWMDVEFICDRSVFDSADTYTTTAATNGANSTVTVGNSAGFYKGELVKIAGAGIGGTDFYASIVKVVSSTSIVLDKQPPLALSGLTLQCTRYVLSLKINGVQVHKLPLSILPTASAHMGFLGSGSVANTDGADIAYAYQLPLDINKLAVD